MIRYYLIFFLSIFCISVNAQDKPALIETNNDEIQDLVIPDVSGERLHILLLDSVTRPNSYWLQAQLSGTFYDARADTLIGRISPGLQFGKRLKEFGLFATVEFDRTYDFTLDTETLDVLNIGLGGEAFTFLGHVRSSLVFGLSILLSDTVIDDKGEIGWFFDFRPASLRWALNKNSAVELTPLTIDIVAPVTQGIPIVIFSYMTVISYERTF